jgi:hypothetical protein
MASEDQVKARRGYLRRRPYPALGAPQGGPYLGTRPVLALARGPDPWCARSAQQVIHHSRCRCGQDLSCRVSTVAGGK